MYIHTYILHTYVCVYIYIHTYVYIYIYICIAARQARAPLRHLRPRAGRTRMRVREYASIQLNYARIQVYKYTLIQLYKYTSLRRATSEVMIIISSIVNNISMIMIIIYACITIVINIVSIQVY